jgi:phosphatidylserine/phosphatidylglycerophosphate/cardiolipin synthase-like enzyme
LATALLLCVVALLTIFAGRPAFAAELQVCFTPPLPVGCDPLTTVVQAIDGAQKTVLAQIYALTSREIVTTLVNARRRAIDARVIVDRSQLEEDSSDAYAVGSLEDGGDREFQLYLVGRTQNAESLKLIYDPALAAEYTQNWNDL